MERIIIILFGDNLVVKLWVILECYGCNFCCVNFVVFKFEDVYLWNVDLF